MKTPRDMEIQSPSRRRLVSGATLLLGTMGLPACGGGTGNADAAVPIEPLLGTGDAVQSVGTAGQGTSAGPYVAPQAPQAGVVFTSVVIQSDAVAGVLPYQATLMPTIGQVPAGAVLQSPDDGSMQHSVLSAWPDGSAALVVVSGLLELPSGTRKTLRVQCAADGTATLPALKAERIAALVRSIAIDFGALGVASVGNLAAPERIWWANGHCICARYRAAAPSHPTLEAVIDVHAFQDARALVEIVVENSKIDAVNTTASTVLAKADYANATITVNGASVASVSGTSSPEGTHAGHRAWYAAHWIGGNPNLRATQLHTDLQAHPLLFKCDQAASFDMSAYASDAYVPWGTGRHRATGMGGTGDHPSIGPIPKWEAHALQSGDARAWAATEASCLAMLSYNINLRDLSGVVPHSAIMPRKCQGSSKRNWPRNTAEPAFESAHQPASGLMAFLARPSPVYIEVAQKIAVWAGTVEATNDFLLSFNATAVGITDCTGLVGSTQVRAKAWGPRNIAHATWLTPSAHPWRAGGAEWMDRNTRFLEAYAATGRCSLLPIYGGHPFSVSDADAEPTIPGVQISLWMYHFVVAEWHKIASSKLLSGVSTARQAAVSSLADAMALAVAKWVTEQPNGGWRFLPYRTTLGDSSGNMAAFSNWGAQRAFDLSGAPSSVSGQWSSVGNPPMASDTTWAQVEARGFETTAGSGYPSNFWTALVAAVERGVPGSQQAWNTVNQSITNMAQWRSGFAKDPRHGASPRNL